MALAALAGDDDWSRTWQALLQHRFPGAGELGGHAVGNLLITALAETTGGVVEALDLVGRLVGARGRVLPASTTPLQIVAQVPGLDPGDPGGLTEVVGQVAVATTAGSVCALRLEPKNPPACAEAVQAVLDADFVVLGPGSWFTSVLTHLLVPDLRAALVKTSARKSWCSTSRRRSGRPTASRPRPTSRCSRRTPPELVLDVVLADVDAVLDSRGLMYSGGVGGGPAGAGTGRPRRRHS